VEKVKEFHEQKLIPSLEVTYPFPKGMFFQMIFVFQTLVGYINSSYCRWFNKSGDHQRLDGAKTTVNNGISTTGSSTGELIPDFWLPSTVFVILKPFFL